MTVTPVTPPAHWSAGRRGRKGRRRESQSRSRSPPRSRYLPRADGKGDGDGGIDSDGECRDGGGGTKGGGWEASAPPTLPTSSAPRAAVAFLGWWRDTKSPGRHRNSAILELLAAASIYALCISGPVLLGMAVRFYEDRVLELLGLLAGTVPGWGGGDGDGPAEVPGIWEAPAGTAYYYSDQAWRYACESSRYLTGADLGWCATAPPRRGLAAAVRRVFYDESTVRSDLVLVVVLSVLLAAIRVLLVSILVPRYLAPRRLAVMARTKSNHLLSSATYEFSPFRAVRRISISGTFLGLDGDDDEGASPPGLSIPDLDAADLADARAGAAAPPGSGRPSLTPRQLAGLFVGAAVGVVYRMYCVLRGGLRRALGHEPAHPYEKLDATTTLRLFSAPRLATAIFRALYLSGSCAMAFVLFRSADFWPVYVGGRATSSTRNCWDRSGGLALGSLDTDFDQKNKQLHMFFLAQGAYQLHSLCFHVLSMVLLLVYGGDGNERLLSMKSSMKSYLRPLTEHLITISLMLACYVFSGLRRLGALGIFTLESSSLTLQLLQVCVNAPEKSILRHPKFVKRLHRYIVVPSFLYCRFFVLPLVIWYSAAFESQDWLEQIERMFVPGSAMAFFVVFNGMFAFIFGLNLIFFRRLLFHPVLKDIYKEAAYDEAAKKRRYA